MNVVFAGTPDFARVALQSLLAAGFRVPLVLTQPDRPAGRGMKLQASPVKQLALEHGIAVAQPRSLRLDGKYPDDAAAAQQALQAAQADVMVVAAYGLILPQWVLSLPRLGCLNIHASLLPRWRGAAPIHRAIEAGDAETGVTIMQMDAGLDTGDMLLVERLPIGPAATTGTLHDQLAALGGRLIVEALELAAAGPPQGGESPLGGQRNRRSRGAWGPELAAAGPPQGGESPPGGQRTTRSGGAWGHDPAARGGLSATPQPAEGVTYAHKIDKHEAAVDWSQPAAVIERRIRAFDPFPGVSTRLGDETVKLWRSELDSCLRPSDAGYGQILLVNDAGVTVACGDGSALRLTELQRAGGKRLPAREFLRGFPLQAGQRFDSAAATTPQEPAA